MKAAAVAGYRAIAVYRAVHHDDQSVKGEEETLDLVLFAVLVVLPVALGSLVGLKL